jgi:hypothetical protein
MTTGLRTLVPLLLLTGGATAVSGQSLPTTQPPFLTLIREEVKPGRVTDHAKIEAGWPAAFEKAKSPYFYIGLVSMTGANEAWFVSPYKSQEEFDDSMKREDADPVLSAELSRLSRADADVVNSVRTIHARALADLSHGAFPDSSKERFWEITIFRVRPGHYKEFVAAAKAFGAAADRAAPNLSYRVYEVMAGMPGPTYLVFSSTKSFGDFDKDMAAGDAIMKAMTDDERAVMQKFEEGLVNSETQRFRLSPEMSYVPKDVRASDPAFWMPKKTTMKSTAATPAPKPAAAAKPPTQQ